MEHLAWNSVPLEVLSETFSRKIITGERAMIAQVFVKKGGVIPEHHHESEQLSYVLTGSLRFELEGKEVLVGAGDVLVIASQVPHRIVALEDSLSLDVFSPIRHDWLAKDDAYLRGDKVAPEPPRL
ncbi:MAG TPA: cupin domain-containing protein [Bryobacteraceae bacterium]|nr:cupin domain-containing protein [Bryobacteraceae bacterium]